MESLEIDEPWDISITFNLGLVLVRIKWKEGIGGQDLSVIHSNNGLGGLGKRRGGRNGKNLLAGLVFFLSIEIGRLQHSHQVFLSDVRLVSAFGGQKGAGVSTSITEVKERVELGELLSLGVDQLVQGLLVVEARSRIGQSGGNSESVNTIEL